MPSWANSGQAAHEHTKCLMTAAIAGTTVINTSQKYLM